MFKSAIVRITLAFLLCVFATLIIRHRPLAPAGIGERIAIALVWVVGVAYMIRTISRNN